MQTIMRRNCFKCDFFWFFLPPLQKNLQTFYTFLVALTWAIPSMAVKRLPFTLFKIDPSCQSQVVATCHRGTRSIETFPRRGRGTRSRPSTSWKVSFPFYSGSPFPLTINSQAASFHTILGRHESEEKPCHWHLDSSIFQIYVYFQQLLILCVSVRDHRRGAGDPFSERPEPAAEDARPEQGRDRADEATVSFPFSSPPMRCTDRTVFLVTFCPFPRKVTWPISFSWLSCNMIHTQSLMWRSNHFHTKFSPLLFVCYGDVAVHTNPN